jgi:hypothetical protein
VLASGERIQIVNLFKVLTEDFEMFEMRKLFLFLAAGTLCLTLASTSFAVNLVVNGNFATDISGWSTVDITTSDTALYYTFDGTSGYPAGSAKLQRAATNPAVATNGHRFYQFIPVAPSTRYFIRGQWKGDLAAGTTIGMNWAEVYIGFTRDVNIAQPNWTQSLRYRKQWDGVNNVNVASSGQWNWENITTSPEGTAIGGLTTAATDQNYMVIAFSLGGSVLTPQTAQPYISIDNVQAVACSSLSAADVNMDCLVNFLDLSTVANQWLTCNVDPASSCW